MRYTLSEECIIVTDTDKNPVVLTIIFNNGQRWAGTEKELATVIETGQYVIDQLKKRKQ